jgi:long-chain acyl-CoA synthetase
MSTTTSDRGWTALYPAHVSPELDVPFSTLAEAWAQRVHRAPDEVALQYFDTELSAALVDRMADALAAEFQAEGMQAGDRVGIQLQNIPHFAIAELAAWKIGAVPLVLNPMYIHRELETILDDARPRVVIGLEGSTGPLEEWSAEQAGTSVLTANDRDWQSGAPDGAFAKSTASDTTAPRGDGDLATIIAARDGQRPTPVAGLTGDDPALLTYTSGTTGPAKGALSTHRALLAVAWGNRAWYDIAPGDRILAVAPLFHITGAVATGVTALTGDTRLVCINRFTPAQLLRAIREYRINHLLGSITVYNGLLDLPGATAEDLATVKTVYSGGAPVPPATVKRFEDTFGHYIHNIYGMTETSSAVVGVPLGCRAPVDPGSGTLAVGVPLPGLDARVVPLLAPDEPAGAVGSGSAGAADPEAAPSGLAPGTLLGEPGELELRGPQITPGYLNKPEATAQTFDGPWLRTGDVAIMDAAGWIYLVDRSKDQINVSGYKVWPREVEDALYEHPAVFEAAVVGLPDEYSGERVEAFVSLQHGSAGGEDLEDGLRAHVRERLAAYKTPKRVHIIEELPKTATGKIQRRKLRG